MPKFDLSYYGIWIRHPEWVGIPGLISLGLCFILIKLYSIQNCFICSGLWLHFCDHSEVTISISGDRSIVGTVSNSWLLLPPAIEPSMAFSCHWLSTITSILNVAEEFMYLLWHIYQGSHVAILYLGIPWYVCLQLITVWDIGEPLAHWRYSFNIMVFCGCILIYYGTCHVANSGETFTYFVFATSALQLWGSKHLLSPKRNQTQPQPHQEEC